MSYGIVIKKDDGHFQTPNKGVLMDLETGIKYNFARESSGSGVYTDWNIKVHDIVSFDIDGNSAKNVQLVKKHVDGVVYSYSS